MGVISTNNHTQNLASPIGEMVSLTGVPAPGTIDKAATFQKRPALFFSPMKPYVYPFNSVH
jgi:hypothetical protein